MQTICWSVTHQGFECKLTTSGTVKDCVSLFITWFGISPGGHHFPKFQQFERIIAPVPSCSTGSLFSFVQWHTPQPSLILCMQTRSGSKPGCAITQLHNAIETAYRTPFSKQYPHPVPYPTDTAADKQVQQLILSKLPELSSQHLLALSRSIIGSCYPLRMRLGWKERIELQHLVLLHAIPAWLKNHKPVSCGVCKPFEVTAWDSFPTVEAKMYWVAKVAEFIRSQAIDMEGLEFFDKSFAPTFLKTVRNLYICTSDDGVDVTLAGFCLLEGDLGSLAKHIHIIASALPRGSGVGRALVGRLKRWRRNANGCTVTADNVLPASEGFFDKMGVPYKKVPAWSLCEGVWINSKGCVTASGSGSSRVVFSSTIMV